MLIPMVDRNLEAGELSDLIRLLSHTSAHDPYPRGVDFEWVIHDFYGLHEQVTDMGFFDVFVPRERASLVGLSVKVKEARSQAAFDQNQFYFLLSNARATAQLHFSRFNPSEEAMLADPQGRGIALTDHYSSMKTNYRKDRKYVQVLAQYGARTLDMGSSNFVVLMWHRTKEGRIALKLGTFSVNIPFNTLEWRYSKPRKGKSAASAGLKGYTQDNRLLIRYNHASGGQLAYYPPEPLLVTEAFFLDNYPRQSLRTLAGLSTPSYIQLRNS